MSMSKRILFGNDPQHDEISAEIKRRNWEYVDQFPFRISSMKFKNKDGKRRKDVFWDYALMKAESSVKTESVRVNGGVFFRTEHERDAVLKIAAEICEAPHAMKRYC